MCVMWLHQIVSISVTYTTDDVPYIVLRLNNDKSSNQSDTLQMAAQWCVFTTQNHSKTKEYNLEIQSNPITYLQDKRQLPFNSQMLHRQL